MLLVIVILKGGEHGKINADFLDKYLIWVVLKLIFKFIQVVK